MGPGLAGCPDRAMWDCVNVRLDSADGFRECVREGVNCCIVIVRCAKWLAGCIVWWVRFTPEVLSNAVSAKDEGIRWAREGHGKGMHESKGDGGMHRVE